jgi:PPP family 3-phenylpropionic acid transporter
MTTVLPSFKTVQIRYTLLHLTYWSAYAAFAGFQTALLLERGFSSGDAGVFAALRCLAGIISQPLIGGWADRHPKVPLKYVLVVCLSLALGITALFYVTNPGFLGTAIIIFLLGALELNAYPLLNSLAMQFVAVGVDVNYSLSRGLGSLAYAISCVVLGRMSAAFGVENVLLVNIGFLLALIAAALMFPTAPVISADQKNEGEKPHSVLYILKNNPPFTLMMVAVFFCMTAMMPIENFMYNIVEGNGGDETHLGLALFIVGAAELPSAFIFTKLKPHMKVQTMVVLAIFFVMFKSACMLIPVLSVILLVQLLQMFGYGLFLPSSVYYVNENVPVVDRVRGQAIMMMSSTGLGGVFGNVIAGKAIDLGGVHMLIVFCVICGVISSALAVTALVWTGKRGAA